MCFVVLPSDVSGGLVLEAGLGIFGYRSIHLAGDMEGSVLSRLILAQA